MGNNPNTQPYRTRNPSSITHELGLFSDTLTNSNGYYLTSVTMTSVSTTSLVVGPVLDSGILGDSFTVIVIGVIYLLTVAALRIRAGPTGRIPLTKGSPYVKGAIRVSVLRTITTLSWDSGSQFKGYQETPLWQK